MAFPDRPLRSPTVFAGRLAVDRPSLSGNHTAGWTDDGLPNQRCVGPRPAALLANHGERAANADTQGRDE